MTAAPDPLTAELTVIARQIRAQRSATRRAQARHRRWVATTGATLVGALLDCCDAGVAVQVETVSGAQVAGRVALACRDAIAVGATLIPVDAVAGIRVDGRHDVTGRRTAADRPSFAATVGTLAAGRATVAVGRRAPGCAPIVGRAWSAGVETLVIRTAAGQTAVVPLAQVSELTVLASG